MTDSERDQFRYSDKGNLATIGRKSAVAQFRRFQMAGFFAWIMWLLVHILFLIGFRNRLIVMIQWIWSYFSYSRGARLITGRRMSPGKPEVSAHVRPRRRTGKLQPLPTDKPSDRTATPDTESAEPTVK